MISPTWNHGCHVCTTSTSYFLSYTFISFDPCKNSVTQKTDVREWNIFKHCFEIVHSFEGHRLHSGPKLKRNIL